VGVSDEVAGLEAAEDVPRHARLALHLVEAHATVFPNGAEIVGEAWRGGTGAGGVGGGVLVGHGGGVGREGRTLQSTDDRGRGQPQGGT
jgi:hypothetical protein